MNTEQYLPKHRDLFYAGAWHPAKSGKTFESINPATQASLGFVANADQSDVDAIVESAQQAFQTWKTLAPQTRADYLKRAAKTLLEHKREIAMVDALDGGNPVKLMEKDVDYMAASIEYYAGLVLELKGETIPMPGNQFNYTIREPLGVIAHIVAFNHPALFVGWTIGASLGAGNTVIIKPAEQTPLSALYIAELFADIFPAGVFNVITGDRDTGPLLTQHPSIRKIIFIGSVATGKAIMASSADSIRPVTLEMGGKNALIIYPDADPMKAAQTAIAGMNLAWCGQSCGSTSRIFVHESIHDEVLANMINIAKTVNPGDPTQDETIMGCLASKAHFDKVQSYIQIGLDDGATLAYGGEQPEDNHLSNGNFLKPTIFSNVQQHMRIANEEIFGPIMGVLQWSDEDTMINEVNSVDYGLTAAIWTNDINKAHNTAKKVQAGYVWINQAGPHFLGAPFGGQKQSGIGRLGCLQTMLDCTQLKNINIALEG